MAAPTTPTKGQNRTAPGRRPRSGAWLKALLLFFKSLSAQVGRFVESRFLMLTHQSNCSKLGATSMGHTCRYNSSFFEKYSSTTCWHLLQAAISIDVPPEFNRPGPQFTARSNNHELATIHDVCHPLSSVS